MGYKEIEVGFPAASARPTSTSSASSSSRTRSPTTSRIQVLTQAATGADRADLRVAVGAPPAIVHLYNSTSTLQRRVVFGQDRDGIKDIAVAARELVREVGREASGETDCASSTRPESFTGTELRVRREVCEAVGDVWQPTPEKPMILNLPATVEMATPNIYADSDRVDAPQPRRGATRSSCRCTRTTTAAPRVAAAELGVHGRRRPRRGLPVRQRRAHRQRLPGDPGPEHVHPGHRPADRLLRHRRDPAHGRVLQPAAGPPRHPYGGDLVFTAFSGSHQDAINKGFEAMRRRGVGGRARGRRPPGRCRTCRSTRRTSAAPTRRSSGSTPSRARAASPT